jgi:hypothetical protein
VKIAHEAPISIFNTVQRATDYDYALVHMFEENPVYWRQFKDAVINGREVLLDNSIFELGTAFDSDKYVGWINKLNPTWFIIPDVLEDTEGTKRKLDEWMRKYDTQVPKTIKRIGVIQGKSYEEIVDCYKYVEPMVEKVAISFDFSYYDKTFDGPTKWHRLAKGRPAVLDKLLEDGIINIYKPHHLLGCALPQEFLHYKNEAWKYKWIDSVDTSNPVVHGLNGVTYTDEGLEDKISTKLIEYMDEDVNTVQLLRIAYNIDKFRSFCK